MPAQGGQRAGQGEYVTSARQPESSASLPLLPATSAANCRTKLTAKLKALPRLSVSSLAYHIYPEPLNRHVEAPCSRSIICVGVCATPRVLRLLFHVCSPPSNILKRAESIWALWRRCVPAVVAIILSILSTSHFISSHSSRASLTVKSDPSSTFPNCVVLCVEAKDEAPLSLSFIHKGRFAYTLWSGKITSQCILHWSTRHSIKRYSRWML